MEYKKFKSTILLYKEGSDMIHELYSIGVDLIERKYKLLEIIDKQLHISLTSEYTKDGIDWIDWFIYENEYGNKDWSKIKTFSKNLNNKENKTKSKYGAHDHNNKPICYDIKSLWEYIEKNHKIYNMESIKNAFISAKKKNWDKIYVAVDIHDTIVYGNYKTDVLPTTFISNAKEVLQYLSTRKDVVLMLYTCSHPNEIVKYLEFFKSQKINFKYANENPEVPNNALGCYDKKIYFNILFEDKGNFVAERDWDIVFNEFKKQEIL